MTWRIRPADLFWQNDKKLHFFRCCKIVNPSAEMLHTIFVSVHIYGENMTIQIDTLRHKNYVMHTNYRHFATPTTTKKK